MTDFNTITEVLGQHHATIGIMASPTHWAYRGDWAPEGAAPRSDDETPGKWFAGCGEGYEDKKGCGWDSEPTTYEDRLSAKRAANQHVAEEIVKALP